MTLSDYFKLPGAHSLEQLRVLIGAKSTAQVRQWQHGYAGRRPSPAYCIAIERATDGAVSRKDLRSDWQLIWPQEPTQ